MEKIINLSRTKIKTHLGRKTNPSLINTIKAALGQKNWIPIAKFLGNSTRGHAKVNLSLIEKETKTGDTVIVLGKVLSSGEITKKVRICSLGISRSAIAKLKSTKSEYVSILDEIKLNPKAEGLKIIK